LAAVYSVKTHKKQREARWAAWHREQRIRLEKKGLADPPDYDPEMEAIIENAKFTSPDITPELARQMLEDETRRFGPPPKEMRQQMDEDGIDDLLSDDD